MEKIISKKEYTMYKSTVNNNWFIKFKNKLIAGFKNKKDAEFFLEMKSKL